jgi:hypothetical protein
MIYHDPAKVREALAIGANVPLLTCDARDRESCKAVLIALIEHVLTLVSGGTGRPR